MTLLFAASLGCSGGTPDDATVELEGGGQAAEAATASIAMALMPDLVAVPIAEVYRLETATSGPELRFSTTIANRGNGPMILRGVMGPGRQAVAVQEIKLANGGLQEKSVGDLAFDETHNHWHLKDFIIFELWSMSADGQPGALLTSSGKISFCLMDQVQGEWDQPVVAVEPKYIECDWRMQGISEGWSETYVASLPGQSLSLIDVPDGAYLLKTRIDPGNALAESDEGNNTGIDRIEISGGSATRAE